MKIDSLKDVYVSELKDLHSAETQLLKALPLMAEAASSTSLREAFENHLEETRRQLRRLNDIFDKLGMSPKGRKCKAMEGLIAEGKELLDADSTDAAALDAALICAAQKVEHYEIAGYGCVRTFARLLGDEEAAVLLQETLDEEIHADELLNEVAQTLVNQEAVDGTEERGVEREENEGGIMSEAGGDDDRA